MPELTQSDILAIKPLGLFLLFIADFIDFSKSWTIAGWKMTMSTAFRQVCGFLLRYVLTASQIYLDIVLGGMFS